jgi:hypothetical protein
LTWSASSESGSAIASPLSDAFDSTPFGCSERTNALRAPATPAACASSDSRTPVHVWVVVQPSTQAIGSRAVCCGSARSSSSVSGISRAPWDSVSR